MEENLLPMPNKFKSDNEQLMESSETPERDPLRNISNMNTLDTVNREVSPLKLPDSSWTERTEVLTKENHENYKSYARDLVEELVPKAVESSKKTAAVFREVARLKSEEDSESEYESASDQDGVLHLLAQDNSSPAACIKDVSDDSLKLDLIRDLNSRSIVGGNSSTPVSSEKTDNVPIESIDKEIKGALELLKSFEKLGVSSPNTCRTTLERAQARSADNSFNPFSSRKTFGSRRDIDEELQKTFDDQTKKLEMLLDNDNGNSRTRELNRTYEEGHVSVTKEFNSMTLEQSSVIENCSSGSNELEVLKETFGSDLQEIGNPSPKSSCVTMLNNDTFECEVKDSPISQDYTVATQESNTSIIPEDSNTVSHKPTTNSEETRENLNINESVSILGELTANTGESDTATKEFTPYNELDAVHQESATNMEESIDLIEEFAPLSQETTTVVVFEKFNTVPQEFITKTEKHNAQVFTSNNEESIILLKKPVATTQDSITFPQEPVAVSEESTSNNKEFITLPQEPFVVSQEFTINNEHITLPQEPVTTTEESTILPQEPVAVSQESITHSQEPTTNNKECIIPQQELTEESLILPKECIAVSQDLTTETEKFDTVTKESSTVPQISAANNEESSTVTPESTNSKESSVLTEGPNADIQGSTINSEELNNPIDLDLKSAKAEDKTENTKTKNPEAVDVVENSFKIKSDALTTLVKIKEQSQSIGLVDMNCSTETKDFRYVSQSECGSPVFNSNLDSSKSNLDAREEDVIVSQKGYNMEILNKLDDPNFDPFETKSSVSNSPGCELAKQQRVSTESVPSKYIAETIKQDTLQEVPKIDPNDVQSPESILPKGTYNLDVLNTESDVVNPFQTKSVVQNSPKIKSEEDVCSQISTSPILEVDGKKQCVPKSDILLTTSETFENDIPACDYDDVTDPFATRSSIKNSPVISMKCELKINHPKNKEESQSEVEIDSKFELKSFEPKSDTETLPCENYTNSETSFSVNSNKETVITSGEVSTVSTVETEGKTFSDDILERKDDPNLNPFETKCSVFNSPKQESKKLSSAETESNSNQNNSENGSSDDTIIFDATVIEQTPADGPKSSLKYSDSNSPICENTEDETVSCNKTSYTVKDLDITVVINSNNSNSPLRTTKAKAGNDIETENFGSNFDALEDAEKEQQDKIDPTSAENLRKSITSMEFDVIAKEALDLTKEMTPLPTDKVKKDHKQNILDSIKVNNFSFEEFANANDFFSNEEELNALGSYGNAEVKENLARNSLFVKFDPLIAACMDNDMDPRRGSALISFSPCKKPVKDSPQRCLRSDLTVNESTFIEESFLGDVNTTILVRTDSDSLVGLIANTSVQTEEEMVSIQERDSALKNQEIVYQDILLRKSREFEEIKTMLMAEMKTKDDKMRITEEENKKMGKLAIHFQVLLGKIVEKKASMEKEFEVLIKEEGKRHEEEVTKVRQEQRQQQEEMRALEQAFFELVKKQERLRQIVESQNKNKSLLEQENEELKQTLVNKKESFVKVFQDLEEKMKVSENRYSEESKKHENEINKAGLLLKRAEMKIISLVETVQKKDKEIQMLSSLLDDCSKKFDS